MKLQFIILGSGSSLGVPRIDGNFGKCNPKNKKNYRSRCSALLTSKNFNLLIDSSPDIRKQFLDNKIKSLNCVFYTHQHADQTHGINDLRFFYLKNKTQIPVFANKSTSKYLLNSFKYCFKKTSNFYPPIMKLNNLKKKHTFLNNNIEITSFEVTHGSIKSVCYVINDKLAYASDVSFINKKNFPKITNLKYFVKNNYEVNLYFPLREKNSSKELENIQKKYNLKHKITPQTVTSKIKDVMEGARIVKKEKRNKKNLDKEYDISGINYRNIGKEIKKIDKLMRQSAKELDFEQAAFYRDLIKELKEKILINKA